MRIAAYLGVFTLLAACAQEAGTAPDPSPAVTGPMVGMANPAAVACGDLFGGELSSVSTSAGDIGMCTLPDGRVCEEWVLFQDHRCAVSRDAPSIGEPVTPKPPTESRRHSRSGKTGG